MFKNTFIGVVLFYATIDVLKEKKTTIKIYNDDIIKM